MMSAVSTILTTADRLVAAATASSRALRCTKSLIAMVDERDAPDQLDVRIGQKRRDDDREGEEQQRRGAGANGDAPRAVVPAAIHGRPER